MSVVSLPTIINISNRDVSDPQFRESPPIPSSAPLIRPHTAECTGKQEQTILRRRGEF